jgi:hypothetical protein
VFHVEPRKSPLVTGGDRFPAWLVKKITTWSAFFDLILQVFTLEIKNIRFLTTLIEGGEREGSGAHRTTWKLLPRWERIPGVQMPESLIPCTKPY